MATFAFVPVVPGPVIEVCSGTEMFPVHADIAPSWISAPDGTQQGYIYNGMVFSAPSGPTSKQLWIAYQNKAREALAKTDSVSDRCFKASVAYPSAWQTYTLALRAIVAESSGDPTQPLPTQPPYPEGT